VSDFLFVLEGRGFSKDEAVQMFMNAFDTGFRAALDRLRPSRPMPPDAPTPSDEQLAEVDAIAAAPAPAAKKKTRVAKVQRRIPDDFEMTDERLAYGTGRGFSRAQVAGMFENFVGYYRQTGKQWADWDATWQTWVRRQVERNNQSRGPDDRGGGFL
jgi:hypothetical protein